MYILKSYKPGFNIRYPLVNIFKEVIKLYI
jgi:hypothetical protein